MNRAISCATTNHGGRGRGGRGGRNSNRGHGRGGRGYSYGRNYSRVRGRGRGRGGRGYSPRQQYNQFNYYTANRIPDNVWYKMTPAERYNIHHQRRIEGARPEGQCNKNVSGLITDGSDGDSKPDNIMVPYNPAASNATVSSDNQATANPADQFGQKKP